MPSFNKKAASAFLLASVAVADPLTVITPCPAAPTDKCPAPITVTKQYQPVSTCEPYSACIKGSCTTKFPYNTWTYLNTVVPCGWNGDSCKTSTTITEACASVTVAHYEKTITSWETPTQAPVTSGWGDWANWQSSSISSKPKPTPIPHYTTIIKDCVAAYEKIGPMGIPGWGGSGLCQECKEQPDGAKYQYVNVTECTACETATNCKVYPETWVSKPAPSTTSNYAATCTSKFVAPTAGDYTMTFAKTCPGKTFIDGDKSWTAAPSPYYVYATRHCYAGEDVDMTTTITKTLTWTVPCETAEPTWTKDIPLPTGKDGKPYWPWNPEHEGGSNGWGDWFPAPPPAPKPSAWNDWSKPTSKMPSWEDWTASATVSTSAATLTISGTVTTSVATVTIGSSSDVLSTSQATLTISGTVTTSAATVTVGPTDSVSVSVSVSVSTATATQTSVPPPVNNGFLVSFTVPSAARKYHKRADTILYLAFGASSDGFTVTNRADASSFTLDVFSYLRLGTDYVGADTTSGATTFERFVAFVAGISTFQRNADGTAFIPNAAGVCLRGNIPFVYFNDADRPADCTVVSISAPPANAPSSSSATVTATSTQASSSVSVSASASVTQSASVTSSAATTSTFDPSADLTQEPRTSQTAGPVRRGIITGGHYQRRH